MGSIRTTAVLPASTVCSAPPDPDQFQNLGAATGSDASGDAEAARVLERWRDFPATRRPRPIVLIGELLQEAGYVTGDAKLAVATGRVELAAPVPRIPSRMAVRLPGGTFELPTTSAKAAFATVLAAGDPANAPDVSPAPLRITRVALGTARYPTDRGVRTLPAWLFHARESLAPLAVPALHPSAFWHPGEFYPGPMGEGDLTTDGRLLTITMPVPDPPASPEETYVRYVPVVVESGTAVLIRLHAELGSAPPVVADPGCGDEMVMRYADYTVRLAAPLGNRVAIDLDGQPLPVTPA
ncbi:MAG TPA: hypothetical protein VFR67_03450 [Pilimelia sp.]|nr:hypothetical protein [Pilimelia sp.]